MLASGNLKLVHPKRGGPISCFMRAGRQFSSPGRTFCTMRRSSARVYFNSSEKHI